MDGETPKSKKSKLMGKQLDIRQFMLKEMKSQGNPSSPRDNEVPSNVSESLSSQSFTSPQTQRSNEELDNSSVFSEPLQEEKFAPNQRNVVMGSCIRSDYETRLKVSLTCLRFLLRQGLTCCEYEYGELTSRGNFLELLKLLAEHSESVKKIVFENGPYLHQMASPKIQKDLINCCAKETVKCIIQGLGDDYFGILVDVSSDVAQKEHIAVCLRFVDGKTGMIVERFIGLVHVGDTTALSLKNAIISLLMDHSLSPSKIRGQIYDGASNMIGEISGLKTLIMKDIPCAYYVHCFAHKFQSTVVAVARKNDDCNWFFVTLAKLVDVVGVSCKRREMIQVSKAQKVAQALALDELESGLGLKKFDDTQFGFHYRIIFNVIQMFSTVVEVLEMIEENALFSEDRVKAQAILYSMESFDFVFMAHLMLVVLGYTYHLGLTLQRRDIINALDIVSSTKLLLLKQRDCGWETLLNDVTSFCTKYDIVVPDMDSSYRSQGRSRRFVQQETNLQHFQFQLFVGVINLQLNELNDRFDEVNMELLKCMACLSPLDDFSSFHKKNILKFASFYPSEFSSIDLMALEIQLDIFIGDMRRDDRFEDLDDLSALSMMLVETNKHVTYPAIYLLIKLMLILPVATAGVEKVLSGMTYVKNRLQNSKSDQLLNDCLVTFIENDVFLQISDDVIDSFQKMRAQRAQL